MRLPGLWTIYLVSSISVARFTMGAYTALFGPTLLYLADNVGADVYKISIMFTSRSVGTLVGSMMGGAVKKVANERFNHLLSLGIGIGALGITDFVVPWINEFWVLIADVIVGGLMFGYLDAGLQAIILRIWGEKASRPLIQIFHLTYSVGAFVSPFIADPFLAEAHNAGSVKSSCSSGSIATTTPSTLNISTTSPTQPSFTPVGWAYIIVASMMVVAAVLLIILSSLKAEAKTSANVEESGSESEHREEEPIRNVLLLFLLVIGYYFCSTTTENLYYNYIYSISLCSDMNFTVMQASTMTSIFFLGFGLGRATGVVASNFVKPKAIIAVSIFGSITDMMFMVAFGAHHSWLPWVISISHGYTTAMLYPSGVSLLSQMTNISGTYMFVCNIGNATGSLSMLLLAGYLFDNVSPFSVMYLILGLSALNALFFLALLFVGRDRLRESLYNAINEGEHSSLLASSTSAEVASNDVNC